MGWDRPGKGGVLGGEAGVVLGGESVVESVRWTVGGVGSGRLGGPSLIPVTRSIGSVLQDLGETLALGVGVVPEVDEEEEEEQAVQADDVDENGEPVGAVLHEEVLADVRGHQHKLDLRHENTQEH